MSRQVTVLLLLWLVTIAGCARPGDPAASVGGSAPAAAKASEANRFLAYEHTLDLETDEDQLVAMFDEVQAACRAAVEDSCAILQARVSSGVGASASLKFRATAAGIRKLVAALSAQGKVESQSTTAEDLAGPIADSAKQIAMLSDFRTSLEALRSRPSNDLEALLRLTRELAEVQSQIETLTGSQAHLMQRVQTELLTVSIRTYHGTSFWAPIGAAGAEFGAVVSGGIAGVILVIGYLLPWLVVGILVVLAVQAFRRWRKRRRADA